MKMYDISLFNEDDNNEHQMKCAFILGCQVGFRGNTEHREFCYTTIKKGKYPANHEQFPGKEKVFIEGLLFKTHRLNAQNGKMKNTTNLYHWPILSDGKTGDINYDVGGTLWRWKEKLMELPEPPKTPGFYFRINVGNTISGKQPKGVGAIRTLIKKAAKHVGIEDWENFRPHSMRALCIQTMANDSDVNNKETMDYVRHNSIASTTHYMKSDSKSSSARLQSFVKKTSTCNKRSSSPIKTKETQELELKQPIKKMKTTEPTKTVDFDNDDKENFGDMSKFTQDEWDYMKSEFEEFHEEMKSKAKLEAEEDERTGTISRRQNMFREMRRTLAGLGDRRITEELPWWQTLPNYAMMRPPQPAPQRMSYPPPHDYVQPSSANGHWQMQPPPPVMSATNPADQPPPYQPPQYPYDDSHGAPHFMYSSPYGTGRRSSW